jgi:pilus assembly protein CpaE
VLSLALITRNHLTAQGIEQLVSETGVFQLAEKLDPSLPAAEMLRLLTVRDPEVILVDLADWELVEPVLSASKKAKIRSPWIGFAPDWSTRQEAAFADAGITSLMREPFGPADLEKAAYAALHEREPGVRPGLWAFLPAKAGGGCSTLVLNTAGALQKAAQHDVLVIEADARSGSFSILMNFKPLRPIHEALENAAEMTALEWQKFHVTLGGVHILPADPSKSGYRPFWNDYYHLLHFLDNRYGQILVDLPELVNDATAEVVRPAESVFVVCTPEVPSLKMVDLRCQDLMKHGVQRERIHLLMTRWKRGDMAVKDVEKNVGWPVYATLGNDYRAVSSAILESRLVSADSTFGKDCHALALKLSGASEAPPERGAFGRLSRLITK